MAPAAVRFHPAAAQEAESAYDWYAARIPAVAHGFLEELRHAVAAVAENPRAWLRYGDRARRYVFPRFPFSLVYVLRGDLAAGVRRELRGDATRRRRGPNLAARPTAGRRPSLPPPDCLLQLSTCLGARRVQVAPRAAAARRVRRAEASRLAPPVRLAPRALDARPARASQPARCAPGAPYAPASRRARCDPPAQPAPVGRSAQNARHVPRPRSGRAARHLRLALAFRPAQVARCVPD